MSAVLPAPAPLPDPPGAAASLVVVLEQLIAAGFSAGLLRHLLPAGAVLPGWTGADAAVAAGEVRAAAGVADELHSALATGVARLRSHAEAWQLVERRFAVLRQQQEEQYVAAASRLSVLVGPMAAMTVGPPPEVTAVIADFVADEAGRSAEHRALLADLADDARETAAVLAAAGGRLGGTGRRGEEPQVTVRLATVLPGWGVTVLTRLGVEAAADLTAPGNVAAVVAAATRYAPYAGTPAFAVALAAQLGADGLTFLLSLLGSGTGTGEGAELAILLAGALTAAGPAAVGAAGAVPAGGHTAALLDPGDPDAGADVVAIGMGVVLAVPGAGAGLAASWGRAVLERERVQGAGAVDRTTSTLPDPVEAALRVLARAADGAAAAELLSTPAAWAAALARSWPDGGADLAAVIGLSAVGTGGAGAARAVLQALGEGLAPGSVGTATADRGTLAAVGDAVGGLVATHVGGVVTSLELAATGGGLDAAEVAGLRGLGLLVSQPGLDGVVTGALSAALRTGEAGAPAEVAGAYVAVQEYGQRVSHALACARELADAVDRQFLAEEVKLAFDAVTWGRGADVAEVGLDVLAWQFGADGAVALPEDVGAVHTAASAARFAEQVLAPAHPDVPAADRGTAAGARTGFRRTSGVLGVPPVPDPSSLGLIDSIDPPDPRDRPDRTWRRLPRVGR